MGDERETEGAADKVREDASPPGLWTQRGGDLLEPGRLARDLVIAIAGAALAPPILGGFAFVGAKLFRGVSAVLSYNPDWLRDTNKFVSGLENDILGWIGAAFAHPVDWWDDNTAWISKHILIVGAALITLWVVSVLADFLAREPTVAPSPSGGHEVPDAGNAPQ